MRITQSYEKSIFLFIKIIEMKCKNCVVLTSVIVYIYVFPLSTLHSFAITYRNSALKWKIIMGLRVEMPLYIIMLGWLLCLFAMASDHFLLKFVYTTKIINKATNLTKFSSSIFREENNSNTKSVCYSWESVCFSCTVITIAKKR